MSDAGCATVSERVSALAHRFPHRVAVADRTEAVTYADLDRRVDALAGTLSEAGADRRTVVATVLARGIPLVTAALATWRAGAALLPLDPAGPPSWNQSMAVDAGATVLVATSALHRPPGVRLVDPAPPDRSGPQPSTRRPSGDPTGLAYLIPTAGTTGTPKLVMVGHDGVTTLMDAQRRWFGDLGEDARVLLYSSPVADGWIFELLLGLGTASRLEVVDQETPVGPPLARLLADRAVTHAILPAAVLDSLPEDDLPRLRTVLSVGSPLSPTTARRWIDRCVLVNGYGPTEATVASTLHRVDRADLDDGNVPIGRPLPGYEIVVVDPEGRPVDDGQPGELVILGTGVAHGYLNAPGPTAERFSLVDGRRSYRTGDRGSRDPDGLIRLLGRLDAQVKVRGFRVEPAGVESALLRLPGIRSAAVSTVPLGGADGGEPNPGAAATGAVSLVAHVVPAPGYHPSGTALRAGLARDVPPHLVPDLIVVVDALPLTAAGKVDRRRLDAPAPARPPRGPTEHAIAAIVEELVGIDGVGMDDDLTDVGWHSLLTTQVAFRIERRLGVRLTLEEIVRAGTVGRIAAVAADRQPETR
ncbi:non-ribosomal peptide synthetase [Micromonospora rifamycinica]|uniref:non-ribosomal peptide synthetase n=1 Tax=Micromonospora rifamycinica TaxID=291594 RepID=UPI003436F6A0